MSMAVGWRCLVCASPDCETAEGTCHCGCGEPAPIAKRTTTKYGHVKGQPVRYINGHYQRSMRLSSMDYVVDNASQCWIWQRSATRGGYGRMRHGGQMQYAHRVYYSQRRRRAKQAEARVPYPRRLIKDFTPTDYWVDPTTGCWVRQRYLGVEGYALKRRDGKKIPAHRYYYEMYRGSIPADLMMDHLCRNRVCVNPYHLEPVTAKENAARRDRAKRKRALRVLR
jgi:hypothetical protein